MGRELLTYEKLSQVIGDLLYGPPRIGDGNPIFPDDVVMEEPVPNRPGYINIKTKGMYAYNVKQEDWDQALRDNAVQFLDAH